MLFVTDGSTKPITRGAMP